MSKEFRCPVCGKPLSPNARSCGGCGARREGTEWFAPDVYDGLGLDEDDFDYEEFLRREFGDSGAGRGNWFLRMTPKERLWWVTAVILLLAFVLAFVWQH
jgi:hypothetical protein